MNGETVHLVIPAIHCDGCLKAVRKAVDGVGARYESGDADTKRVVIEVDPETASVEEIMEALEGIGFAAGVDKPA